MKRLVGIGLALLLSLGISACERPARSASYFESHPDERKLALSDCQMGTLRGRECETAASAAAAAQHQDAENFFRAGVRSK